jgi:hypothetical protein
MYRANILAYSVLCTFCFSALFFFIESSLLLRCKRIGVIKRWILGARNFSFLPRKKKSNVRTWKKGEIQKYKVGLNLTLLDLEWLADDILAHIVVLGQVEQLADLVGSLGAANAWHDAVGQAIDLLLALLHDHEGEHAQVGVDNAALDGLASALTAASLAIAAVALGEQEAHSVVGEDTLLHWEALLVVTTGDLDDVTLKNST